MPAQPLRLQLAKYFSVKAPYRRLGLLGRSGAILHTVGLSEIGLRSPTDAAWLELSL